MYLLPWFKNKDPITPLYENNVTSNTIRVCVILILLLKITHQKLWTIVLAAANLDNVSGMCPSTRMCAKRLYILLTCPADRAPQLNNQRPAAVVVVVVIKKQQHQQSHKTTNTSSLSLLLLVTLYFIHKIHGFYNGRNVYVIIINTQNYTVSSGRLCYSAPAVLFSSACLLGSESVLAVRRLALLVCICLGVCYEMIARSQEQPYVPERCDNIRFSLARSAINAILCEKRGR